MPKPSTDFSLGKIDQISLPLVPKDSPDGLVPCEVYGDGNCLFRAISIALWENEYNHKELRIRTALEMAAHEDCYYSDIYLSKGLKKVEKLSNYFCMYLENPTSTLTIENVTELYR